MYYQVKQDGKWYYRIIPFYIILKQNISSHLWVIEF